MPCLRRLSEKEVLLIFESVWIVDGFPFILQKVQHRHQQKICLCHDIGQGHASINAFAVPPPLHYKAYNANNANAKSVAKKRCLMNPKIELNN